MTVLPVRLFGDPVLTQPAAPVTDFDRELHKLVKDLHDTLESQRGAGLAAPQLGISRRVFVFDMGDTRGHLVNPTLRFPDEEEQDGPEGCLSMPGLYFDTKRRLNVVAKGYTMHGDPLQIVGAGELARCLQHETDHLDGVLFIDRMDSRRRRAALREILAADWNSPPTVKVSPHSGAFWGQR
ncbi:peptide deformylase [Kutzneria kofuensis]|uniref:Peptide deformylase n=1 Tax=Kutzneria kofuensis TaxID=103725 RepID=A0A7W9KRB2_9PSEU|nr:peptide deformylase [Kutzneria kofuensis]MBB5897269.1 peptide deformylase [Kutzneria kofuensis]